MTTTVLCAARTSKAVFYPQIFLYKSGNRVEVYVIFDNGEVLRRQDGPPDNLEAARAWAALMMEAD